MTESTTRGPLTIRERIDAFGTVDGQLAVGGVPLRRLAARIGSTPFFAYDRRLLDERVALLRAALPSRLKLSYAMKANPMPAVVQHLAGLVDSIDVASALEMQTALDTGIGSDHVELRRPGQDRRGDPAGRRRRRDHRAGVDHRGPADRRRGGGARGPAARRHPRQPRLRGQGLGHADGRGTAAVRGGRRAGARRCWPSSARRTSTSPASTSSPGRRTCGPRSSPRRSGRPSISSSSWPSTCPRRAVTSTSAAGSASPTSTGTSRSTWRWWPTT